MGSFTPNVVAQQLLALCAVLAAVRSDATSVQVVGRQLIVDGHALHLKGVCWNPVPKGGVHPKDLDFRGFVESDSRLMAQAGINAVRTYDAITDRDVLDILWKRGIYVLNTVYVWGKAPMDTVVKSVNAVKDHPSILMWVVGNEWNYNGLYVGLTFPDALARVKRAVQVIKENDSTHPVATVHGEIPNGNTLSALPDVDVWGVNKYSGLSFGDLFDQWAALSSAPIFLGEYGADAYNTQTSQVDEQAQAKATLELTQQIVQASSVHPGGVCIGGVIFEFADEWWKDGSGNPHEHDVGGVSPGGGPYPDMTFNEEWWGLVRYDGTPREAYRAYSRIQLAGAKPGLTPGAVVEATAPRLSACGAHEACRGKLGNCCPDTQGHFDACCSSTATTTQAAGGGELPSTTWLPPLPHGHVHAGDSQAGDSGNQPIYTEYRGKFANGHFKIGTLGCTGVGECQFQTRTDAQLFCNSQSTCTAVLLHPFGDGCAGGFGCYTPRYGSISSNSLWDRSGGKAWVKDRGAVSHPQHSGLQLPNKQYIFVGFATATGAQEACKAYGHVAMPKTARERHWLQYAVDAAQAAGKMSKRWPKNTIWLGGYWNGRKKTWEWNDGTAISEFNWADGQPSAAEHQATEPWLCMVLTGQMHDSDPPYRFGIFCEESEEEKRTAPPPALEQTIEGKRRSLPRPSHPPQQEVPVATAHPSSQSLVSVKVDPLDCGPYQFVGFTGPEEARSACGAGKRLAMPKTAGQQRQLKEAISTALSRRVMSEAWPKNTVWIGASWHGAPARWEWDDQTPVVEVNWAAGQPSSSANQSHEPWLCMVADGHIHDSDPPYTFGVMCEDGAPQAHASSKPLPGLAATHVSSQGSPEQYVFVGFFSPEGARRACASHGHLAMPKTDGDRQAVRAAIRAALDAGHMSKEWPNNTIWLGGHWNNASAQWEWDDGTALLPNTHWAEGQPSAQGQQWKEPWLCMVSDGRVHDSEPPFRFGALCGVSGGAGGAMQRGMLDSPAPPLADLLAPTPQGSPPLVWA
mmetsp:Transcript_28006/g.65387  ORF Transcript_28006/g.65387 Transcript_28006/m.65387 type:complete len:1025 (-) Transcript_28006:246-3320(-)